MDSWQFWKPDAIHWKQLWTIIPKRWEGFLLQVLHLSFCLLSSNNLVKPPNLHLVNSRLCQAPQIKHFVYIDTYIRTYVSVCMNVCSIYIYFISIFYCLRKPLSNMVRQNIWSLVAIRHNQLSEERDLRRTGKNIHFWMYVCLFYIGKHTRDSPWFMNIHLKTIQNYDCAEKVTYNQCSIPAVMWSKIRDVTMSCDFHLQPFPGVSNKQNQIRFTPIWFA